MAEDVAITVYLRPATANGSTPSDRWPKLRGVELKLTQQGGKSEVSLKPTDSQGVTRAKSLADNKNYDVTVVTGSSADWKVLDPVTVRSGDEPKNLILVPAEGRCLLPLQLRRYENDGKLVPFLQATCSYQVANGSPKLTGEPLYACSDGFAYAALAPGAVTFSFPDVHVPRRGLLKPEMAELILEVPAAATVDATEILYAVDSDVPASPLGAISIEPLVTTVAGQESLTGASATIEYRPPGGARITSPVQTLGPDAKKLSFDGLLPGIYQATVTAPAMLGNWPVEPAEMTSARRVWAGAPVEYQPTFRFQMATVQARIQASDGRPVIQDVNVEVCGPKTTKVIVARGGKLETKLDWGVPLKIRLAGSQPISIGGIPLDTNVAAQPLTLGEDADNVLELEYQYGVKGRLVDDTGQPVPDAVVDVFNDQQVLVGSGVTGPDGRFTVGMARSGNYYLAPRSADGQPVTRTPAPVNSLYDAGDVPFPVRPATRPDGPATTASGNGARGGADGGLTRKAISDLAAYPVLTEEISSSGSSGPVPGGAAPASADYGQVVDQAVRDVLGWRPSADVSGFRAALTGAFQLREVEGHTEWTWQQRGYSVQADMGALTGAQASIYARAKSALDQILPLLAGLTPLNPALYPPQDLEAIRTVITAQLNELVGELALAGGPRIQRVDQLFGQLLGNEVHSRSLNPDLVQGTLGTLRDRFGLTLNEVDTVDEERIVTNFRIVAEQVLTLRASWNTDRGLLEPLSSRASFGTVLIWLSRSLEAVVDSVNDLTFALDSVFVDAAQRQVIELKLPGKDSALLLSDLLDWIVRASRDEGPRLIQDAGKDGVFAFAPVLRELHQLVQETRHAATHGRGLPDGLRTPRVERALQVVATQLGTAATLAGQVRRDLLTPEVTGAPTSCVDDQGQLVVDVAGINFRKRATAFLFVPNQEDIPDLHARSVQLTQAGARATFRLPTQRHLTWLLVFTNEDGASSPPVTVEIPVNQNHVRLGY